MVNKKAKKKSDERGYSTTSIKVKETTPLADTNEGKADKIENKCKGEDESEKLDPSCTDNSSNEVSDIITRGNIQSELSYIQKGVSFKGYLVSKTAIDVYFYFNLSSKVLLTELVTRARNIHASDTIWLCPTWTYDRGAKVLHALLSLNLSFDTCKDALFQTRGFDERAALEWIVIHHPEKLPTEFTEYPPENPPQSNHDEHLKLKAILQEKQEKAQKVHAEHYKAVEKARTLLNELEKEILESSLPSKMNDELESLPVEDAEQDEDKYNKKYLALQSYIHDLKFALKYLELKREKQIIQQKITQITKEIGQLKPYVKFQRLNIMSPSTNETIESTSHSINELPSYEKISSESFFKVTGDIPQYCDIIDPNAENEIEGTAELSDRSVSVMTTEDVRDEEELNSLFDIFSVESSQLLKKTFTPATAESPLVSRQTTSPVPADKPIKPDFIFSFSKSPAHVSPQKLVQKLISDLPRYTYSTSNGGSSSSSSSKASQYEVTVDVGPLSAAAAKAVGQPRGSFLTATSSVRCSNSESAKEAACLRLVFEITSESKRPQILSKLAPGTQELWRFWVEAKIAHKMTANEELAVRNAEAVEQALDTSHLASVRVSNSGRRTVGVEEEEGYTFNRQKRTYVSVLRDLADRLQQGKLKLEGTRAQLPATQQCTLVVNTINSSDVTILCGETGCGKSTQVPQALLRDTMTDENSDEFVNILVTEPRRVAAVSIAGRVSAELGDSELANALCGYTVRMDSRVGPKCVLEYVTIGVLLRRIQTSRGSCLQHYSHIFVDEVHERSVDSDLLLLLLRAYRLQLGGRVSSSTSQDDLETRESIRFPKIILMSATADEDIIRSYWLSCTQSVATVHIPGRVFPVATYFLEDVVEKSCFVAGEEHASSVGSSRIQRLTQVQSAQLSPGYSDRTKQITATLDYSNVNYDLIHHVIKYELQRADGPSRREGEMSMDMSDVSTGAVLVFLPGIEEIRRVIDAIYQCDYLCRRCVAIPMHSSLSSEELQNAFRRIDPRKRKIVVSTNIAETGITIEDVDLVIDSGLVKSVSWNEVLETTQLKMHLCSMSEAIQRRGRAGRVRPGKCYHLFPRQLMHSAGEDEAEGKVQQLRQRPEPEMKRVPLSGPILSLIDQGFGPKLLLFAPGSTVTISKLTAATNTLSELGAIKVSQQRPVSEVSGSLDETTPLTAEESENILSMAYAATPLGRALASIPCAPKFGLILFAAKHLNCVHPAALFVASLDSKSIFIRPVAGSSSGPVSTSNWKDKFNKRTESDAATIVNAYTEWKECKPEQVDNWCRNYNISMAAMKQLEKVANELVEATKSIKFHGSNAKTIGEKSDEGSSTNSFCGCCKVGIGMHTCVTGGSLEALHVAIVTGIGYNIAFRAQSPDLVDDKKKYSYLTSQKSAHHCYLHQTSVVSPTAADYIAYCTQAVNKSGTSYTVQNVIAIEPVMMLLFSPWAKFFIGDGTLVLGRGIGVKLRSQTLVLIKQLRMEWEAALVNHEQNEGLSELLLRIILTMKRMKTINNNSENL